MAKTIVQKVGSPVPDVSVFKISGTLGFHQNKVLAKFFEECSSRNIRNLVLDLSELDSLGGGCARIVRDAAQSGNFRVSIAGASRTVQNFLSGRGTAPVSFAPDVESAAAGLRDERTPPVGAQSAPCEAGDRERDGQAVGADDAPDVAEPYAGVPGYSGDVFSEVDDLLGGAEPPPPDSRAPHVSPARTSVACEEDDPVPKPATDEPAAETKDLKRRLVRYRALFSLNKEFSRIEDKSRLLDAFLLSIVAQVGVESAAFLELGDEQFEAACWKGFETADPASLNIRLDEVDVETWVRSPQILPVAESPILEGARGRLRTWDFLFAAPFIVHERLRGIVLLGRSIRRALDADAWEFLSMMFDQVGIAYENSRRFEKQSERTLGLVQSLISMIEHNTMSRGTTEMVMDLTYAVAVKLHYPEEHLRDLLYGTVLRDIGMLSASNYIVKSPRELVPEEWEVIKHHPVEGAATLERMGFSEHTCSVVRSHHERYNGEGYPDGLAGPHIPLGARILSVVESYTAMLHDRPTRPALTAEEALNTLEENWGLRYDPEVVKAFSQTLEEDARRPRKEKRRGIDLIKG